MATALQAVTARPRVMWQPAREEDLIALSGAKGPCVTIYAAIDRTIPGRTSLRQLAGDAMESIQHALVRGGWPAIDANRYTGALEIVLDSLELPPAPASGVALFHCETMTRWFPVDGPLAPSACLGARFRLDVLCRDFLSPHEFAILALARKHARMLRVRQGIVELISDIEGFPASFDNDFESAAPSSAKRAGPTIAGQHTARVRFGKADDHEYRALRNFYQAMNKAVRRWLRANPMPAVLAGVTSELAMYRKLATAGAFAEEAIPLSGDGGISDIELGRRGMAVMKTWRTPDERKLRAALDSAPGKRVLQNEKDILRAASQGMVRALFVDWEHGAPHGEASPMNVALVETLKHGGVVCGGSGPMTALLRYRPGGAQ